MDEEAKRELRCWARGKALLVAGSDQTAKPDALAIVEVAKSLDEAAVGCAEAVVELVSGECRAGTKQLAGGPGRVGGLAEQELLELRHWPTP